MATIEGTSWNPCVQSRLGTSWGLLCPCRGQGQCGHCHQCIVRICKTGSGSSHTTSISYQGLFLPLLHCCLLRWLEEVCSAEGRSFVSIFTQSFKSTAVYAAMQWKFGELLWNTPVNSSPRPSGIRSSSPSTSRCLVAGFFSTGLWLLIAFQKHAFRLFS